MSFETLGLSPLILKAVQAAGYDQPTPVQSQAIPAVLNGEDLMVSSSTGSGKTAAFMLPGLNKLAEPSTVRSLGPRILVLTPTRELALQVTKASETYGRFLKRVNVVSVLGGMPYHTQLRQLKQPVEIMVATPGRLLDHMQAGRVDFSRLEILVLDEADRMLDMGFIDDIEAIVNATPKNRQTLMFSATFDGPVGKLAQRLMREPRKIEISSHTTRHENIEQRLHYADNLQHKNELLNELLRDVNVNQAIVFTATKRDADTLADDLCDQGHAAAALHGDMKQGQRNRTLTNMRRGNIRILVATDVAARGIDVPAISHVINFDLPKQAEDYVHRIGRTGRAGRAGIAITLANMKEHYDVKRIERFTAQEIPVSTLPGLEPKTKPKGERGSNGGRPGGGKPAGKSWGNKSGGRSFGEKSFGSKPHGERTFSKPFGEKAFGDKYAAKPFDGERKPRPAEGSFGGEFKKAPRTFSNSGEGRTWEPRKSDANGNTFEKKSNYGNANGNGNTNGNSTGYKSAGGFGDRKFAKPAGEKRFGAAADTRSFGDKPKPRTAYSDNTRPARPSTKPARFGNSTY
ncbi:MAG: DEAD/DEAH box helicase [Burkholderiaceae bacterium]|nr:MAG: DEAD/DEAH box helicase [Burkholderiaceae bacterium]